MGVANYAILTNFGAKDNVSPTFIRMTQSASVFQSRLNGITRTGQKVGKCVSDTINRWAGVGASLFAFNQVKSFGQQTVELAQKQITAEENLQQVLKNNLSLRAKGKDAYKGATADLINFAGELQKKGVIGDEVTIAGMQTLASSGLSLENIKRLTGPMNDLLVHQYKLNATQENAEAVAKGLGRAIYGNAGALSKMNIFLSENEKKMFKTLSTNQRVNLITRKLNKSLGGTNAIMARTDLGAKQQALNNIGDTMENIGKRLIPMQGAVFRKVNEHLPRFEKFVDKTFKTIDFVIKETMPAWTQLGETIKYTGNRVFTEFNEHGESLKNVFTNFIVPGINVTVDAIDELSKTFFGIYDFAKSNWVTIESFLWLFGSAKLAAGILSISNAINAINTANIIGLVTSSNFVWNGLIGTWANIEYIWRTGLVPLFKYIGAYWIPAIHLLGRTIVKTIGKIAAASWSFITTNPIGWVVGAIALIAAGAYLIWKNWDWLKEKFSLGFNFIKDKFEEFKELAKGIFQSVGQWFGEHIISNLVWLREKFFSALTWISDKISQFGNFTKTIFCKVGNWFKTHIIDIFTVALGTIGLVAREIYEIGKRLNLIDGAKVATQSNVNYKTTSDVNLNAKYPEPPMAQNIGSQGNITIGFDKNSMSALDGATPFVSSIKTKNMNLSPA